MTANMALNIDPARADFALDDCASLSPPWVRLVARRSLDMADICDRLRSHGIKVAVGFFGECMEGFASPEQAATFWANILGHKIDLALIVNEMDGKNEPGSSSQAMVPGTASYWLTAFGDAFKKVNPALPLCGPSLISGDADRVWNVNLLPVQSLDIHPYGEDIGINSFLDRYRAVLRQWPQKKTFVIGEWWPNEAATRLALSIPDVDWVAWWWHEPEPGQHMGIQHSPELRAAFSRLVAFSGGDQMPDPAWSADKTRIEEQISLLVENQRRILMGKWDDARIVLDAINPDMAGHWTNAEFPPKA